jgi:cyanophycinase
MFKKILLSALLLATPALASPVRGPGWVYWRVGNQNDIQTTTAGGIAFEGGGLDVPAVYKWMCAKSGNGDFLVIRASGDAAYDPYIHRLCPGINSVATLKIYNRKGALDPFVFNTILTAEALFIAGGNQANYVRYWQGTPVQSAINILASRNVPIGGTSAGNAILGQYAFSALHNTVTSAQALANCFSKHITLDNGFLTLSPYTEALISDDHFVTRDRMGRLVTFLARIAHHHGGTTPALGIGIDENTAILMEPTGAATIVGSSTAYFLQTPGPAETCAHGAPLTYNNVPVYRVSNTSTFNLATWTGTNGTPYTLTATAGSLTSTQPGGGIY